MIACPRCYGKLRIAKGGGGLSAGMPEGTVVLGCLHCRQFMVEGSGQWVGGGAELMESLRILAVKVKQERDTMKAIMESPIEDPRWEDVSWQI